MAGAAFSPRVGVQRAPNCVASATSESALSFALGDLGVGATRSVEILLSDDGSSIGSFALTQFDSDPGSLSELTYSGRVVPEPGTLLLLGLGLGGLAAAGQPRRRSAIECVAVGTAVKLSQHFEVIPVP